MATKIDSSGFLNLILKAIYNIYLNKSGRNSVVEYQLPKLRVAGSSPVARSKITAIGDKH